MQSSDRSPDESYSASYQSRCQIEEFGTSGARVVSNRRRMKKALLIVAAVAGYSLIEAALLLSITVTSPLDRFPSLHQRVVALGQLLLLPGLAALMSRIMFGPFQSLRRTLTILLAGPLSIVAVPPTLLLLVLAIYPLYWADGISRILFVVLLPVVVGVVLAAFVGLVRLSGKWSVKAEASRWLAERQSGASARDRAWRSRSIRFAVCIPLLTTLPIFLFLPETWGLASHVRWPRCGVLAGYRVGVPQTWYIFYHQDEQADGRSYVDGVAGRGVALGGNPFRYGSLSWWSIGTSGKERTDYDWWPPKPGDIFGQRMVKIGSGTLTCVDYLPSYRGWMPPRSQAETIAHIDCSGVGRLHASFDGPRYQLDAFYRMLAGITEMK